MYVCMLLTYRQSRNYHMCHDILYNYKDLTNNVKYEIILI